MPPLFRPSVVPGWTEHRPRITRTAFRVWLAAVVICAALGALRLGVTGAFSVPVAGALVPAAVAVVAQDGFAEQRRVRRVVLAAAAGGVLAVHAVVGTWWFEGAAAWILFALLVTGLLLGAEWLGRGKPAAVAEARMRETAARMPLEDLLDAWLDSAEELRRPVGARESAAVVRWRAALLDELLCRRTLEVDGQPRTPGDGPPGDSLPGPSSG